MGRKYSRLVAGSLALFLAPLFFAQITDQTALVQQQINALPPNGILDCNGATYQVTALQLKSNMTLQNCNFQTLPGAIDFAAPVTIDGRNQPLSNITIRNVTVAGDRHAQTNIGYAGQEDGGRHCFRLLGKLTRIVIDGVAGSYCASDGIALVSYGVGTSDNPADLPFQQITVRNSTFAFNRRHGASGDGLNNITFDNVMFLQNGTTLPGGTEGDHCASYEGSCYGTGFWYEDYVTATSGEGLNNVLFSRCIFRNNFQRSIYFETHDKPSAPGYQPRANVQIVNSYLDAGAEPLTEDYAIQFQVDDSLAGHGAIYQNLTLQNNDIEGSVGFREADNITVSESTINTTLQYLGYSAYSTDILFRNILPSQKTLAADFAPNGSPNPVVTYQSVPSTKVVRPVSR